MAQDTTKPVSERQRQHWLEAELARRHGYPQYMQFYELAYSIERYGGAEKARNALISRRLDEAEGAALKKIRKQNFLMLSLTPLCMAAIALLLSPPLLLLGGLVAAATCVVVRSLKNTRQRFEKLREAMEPQAKQQAMQDFFTLQQNCALARRDLDVQLQEWKTAMVQQRQAEQEMSAALSQATDGVAMPLPAAAPIPVAAPQPKKPGF